MHLMLDYETIGNGADTMTLSLGAVCFNKTGIIGEQEFTRGCVNVVVC